MTILEFELLIEEYFGKDNLTRDNKKRIISELHELGFILDYSKWELNQIIYDPQWLADLFKCIVSLKNHRNGQINIKEGLIEKKLLFKILENPFQIFQQKMNNFY